MSRFVLYTIISTNKEWVSKDYSKDTIVDQLAFGVFDHLLLDVINFLI